MSSRTTIVYYIGLSPDLHLGRSGTDSIYRTTTGETIKLHSTGERLDDLRVVTFTRQVALGEAEELPSWAREVDGRVMKVIYREKLSAPHDPQVGSYHRDRASARVMEILEQITVHLEAPSVVEGQILLSAIKSGRLKPD